MGVPNEAYPLDNKFMRHQTFLWYSPLKANIFN